MERAERACACSYMDRVIPQYVITLVRVLSYTSGPTSARSLVSHADSVTHICLNTRGRAQRKKRMADVARAKGSILTGPL